MTNDDLAYSSAIEALQLFKKRKLSPVELLKITDRPRRKLNGKINCLADCYFDEAMTKAKAAEAALCQTRQQAPRPRRHSPARQGCPAGQGQAHHPRLAHFRQQH